MFAKKVIAVVSAISGLFAAGTVLAGEKADVMLDELDRRALLTMSGDEEQSTLNLLAWLCERQGQCHNDQYCGADRGHGQDPKSLRR
jgi:hypothetical protein